MGSLELWTVTGPTVGRAVGNAVRAEADGWDGITFGDSQNIVGDVWVEMALSAAATTHLRLATWVTNPVTRHPAVTASAAATLQAESGGRVELGIGRGDSALAHLGLAPAPARLLARHVARVQGYLRGEAVPFDVAGDGHGELEAAASLGLADAPEGSRIRWLDPAVAKVPVHVGASGPVVLRLGARLGDGVLVTVGADPARLRWARDTVHEARRAAGLDPAGVQLGAHVAVAVHDDAARARQLVRGKLATHARFAVMHGEVHGPADERLAADLQAVRAAYDMEHHAQAGSSQGDAITDVMLDAYSVAGPAAWCVDRLAAIHALGFTKLLVNTAFPGTDPADEEASHRRVVQEVLPALRARVAASATQGA